VKKERGRCTASIVKKEQAIGVGTGSVEWERTVEVYGLRIHIATIYSEEDACYLTCLYEVVGVEEERIAQVFEEVEELDVVPLIKVPRDVESDTMVGFVELLVDEAEQQPCNGVQAREESLLQVGVEDVHVYNELTIYRSQQPVYYSSWHTTKYAPFSCT
jgi:hypothetical protein